MPVVTRSKLSAEYLDAFGGTGDFPGLTVETGDAMAVSYPVDVPDDASDLVLTFAPGMTTVTTLWITSDQDFTFKIGSASIPMKHGGAAGFANGAVAVSAPFAVNYNPGDGSTAHMHVFAAGS